MEFLLAVDGGGTGTRALVARPDGTVLARGRAGPSALAQGIEAAWQNIQLAVADAFAQVQLPMPDWRACALCAGLSGVHNPELRQALLDRLPPLAHVELLTDGYTMLMGAHSGKPGVVVAAGTGSVGEALYVDGNHRVVGGWGFPVGDEGSGAWLGLQAVRLAQGALDGREPIGALAQAVWAHCGGSRQALAAWCAQAGQFAYAQVAPLVFAQARFDPQAQQLTEQAAAGLEAIALALDPLGRLPVAMCGSVGEKLQPLLSANLQQRCVPAAMDAVHGALFLICKRLALA